MSGILGGIKGAMKKKIVANVSSDPYWNNVTLLINSDGTNGSQTFTDLSSSPKSVTAGGNAQISTGTKKFGTGSMYFDGSGDYLSVAASSSFILDSDFTVECWVNVSAIAAYPRIFSFGTYSAAKSLGLEMSGTSYLSWYNGSLITWGAVASINAWHHIAMVRYGSTITLYVDGVACANTITSATAEINTNQPFYIGSLQSYETDTNAAFNGYIDDFRITKGVARYTTNFTPPTSAFTTPAAASQVAYTTPGTYSWVAPAGVTSVSVVAVGGGSGSGGGGGALAYRNNIPVTPGVSYTVVVGAGGAGGTNPGNPGNSGSSSSFTANSQTTTAGGGNSNGTGGAPSGYYDGGGSGGSNSNNVGYNGCGAGGYSGNGGGIAYNGAAGDAGNGGGGAAGNWAYNSGGGVGLLGQGTSGASNGAGGSGGSNGGASLPGGAYGGGGCGWNGSSSTAGGVGAVRIIWGTGRAFPSTNTQNV